LIAALLLCGTGCWVHTAPPPAGREGDEQQLFLYLEPFTGDAGRIRFTMKALYAVREDGALVRLRPHATEIDGRDMSRQRLVADGFVEPGTYGGVVVEVARAALRNEQGEADLLLPEEPVMSPATFQVQKGCPLALSLSMRFRDAVADGVRFLPVFRVVEPAKPLVGLTGYVTTTRSAAIAVFDKRRMAVVGALPGGNGPYGLVIDPLRKRAYAALADDDAISVIDTDAGIQIGLIRLLGGDRPRELALADRGQTLLAVNEGSGSVSFIDPVALVEVQRTAVGDGPTSLVIDRREGRRAYIFNTEAGSISVIDIPTRSLAATARTEDRPFRGDFNRRGDRLYVLFEGSPFLSVVDPTTMAVVKRLSLGTPPTALKVDKNTDMLYVAKKRSDGIDIYDAVSPFPADVIRTGNSVDWITIDGESNALLLLSTGARTLTAVGINSKNVLSVLDLGEGAYQVSVHGER
jgi:DNA-binding beta-propeller fold protein YncE